MSTKVMAVIHHKVLRTTIENARIAKDAGAAGVALIQMEARDDLLDEPARVLRIRYPYNQNFLIGANRLAAQPHEAVPENARLQLDFTWVDNPGVYSDEIWPTADAITDALSEVDLNRQSGEPKHLLFGGVAFKTQRREPDPASAAIRAANMGWVVTTSGSETGIAPSIGKLDTIRRAIGDHPLAVASGVSPHNVAEIAPYVDYILVATGASFNFHELDFEKLSAIVGGAKRYGRCAVAHAPTLSVVPSRQQTPARAVAVPA